MRAQCSALIATAAVIATVACSDDSFTPSVSSVAGNYAASTLTATTGGTTTDHLAAGGSFTITLATNGTTTGRLFLPNLGGGNFDADMSGTWTLTGSTVSFDQTADTFVRDMTFTAEENRLRGEDTFAGTILRVVLSK